MQGVSKKQPVVKPKIEVKSLQLAQAAAKKERLERERKQKLREEREIKTKKMMENRKLLEKNQMEAKKVDFKKTESKIGDSVKKPEANHGIKRPGEIQSFLPKKAMKLQSPTKLIKKIVIFIYRNCPWLHQQFQILPAN